MQAGIPWIPWTKKPWRRRRPHPLAKHAVDGLFDANIFNFNGGCKAEKFQDKCVMVWNCFLSCFIENILKEWPHKVSNKLYKYVYQPNCSKSSVFKPYSEYPFQKKLRKKRKTKPQNACICTAESEALHLRLEPPRNPRQILWSKWIQWGGMKGKKDSYEKILSYLQWFCQGSTKPLMSINWKNSSNQPASEIWLNTKCALFLWCLCVQAVLC